MINDDSFSAETHSVTRFIERLKDQDPQAAGEIWRRYFERLLPLARARLKALSHRAVDEEDILVSVFDRFFRAAQQDRFAQLHDRHDLWQVLLMLTDRKIADQYRRAASDKRGGQAIVEQSPREFAADIREVADQEAGPEFVAAFNDHLSRALGRLGEATTREVALLRMEGYEIGEIAGRLEISVSSVERKLRVVREVWQEEFGESSTIALPTSS